MPVSIACTSCNARFNVNETTIGKKVKCPKCQAVFQAAPADSFAGGAPRQAAPPAAAGYQQGVPPQPQHQGYGAPPMHQGYGAPPVHMGGGNWGTARTGLMLTLVALIGTAVTFFIMGAYLLAAPSAGGGGNPLSVVMNGGILFTILGCVDILFAILWFVGVCLSCTAPYGPAKSRAKVAMFCIIGMAVIALIMVAMQMFFVASVANNGIDIARQQQFNPNNPPDFQAMQRNAERAVNTGWGIIITMFVLYGILGILGLVALIFWMMFFMAVGDHFHSSSVRGQAIFTLILAILAVPLFWAVMLLLAQLGLGPAAGIRVLGILIIVIYGGLFGMYSMLTAKAMGVIRRGTGA